MAIVQTGFHKARRPVHKHPILVRPNLWRLEAARVTCKLAIRVKHPLGLIASRHQVRQGTPSQSPSRLVPCGDQS